LGRLGVAMVPLQDFRALRQLHLCARNFSALTPHASLLAQRLMESKVAISWFNFDETFAPSRLLSPPRRILNRLLCWDVPGHIDG